MTVRIGRTVVLVRDLDASAAFYRDAFGFETLFDRCISPDFRALHVGPGGVRDAGLWLMASTGDRVGRQTADEPLLVLYVDDLRAVLGRDALQGRVVREPATDGTSTFAHVLDDSGNELVLVQLT